jgi:hypothetical protein
MRETLPKILGILVFFSVPVTGLCLRIETGRAYLSQLWGTPGVLLAVKARLSGGEYTLLD